jgi:hypothetical protein
MFEHLCKLQPSLATRLKVAQAVPDDPQAESFRARHGGYEGAIPARLINIVGWYMGSDVRVSTTGDATDQICGARNCECL